METESKDLQIVTLGEILSENLSIPGYQRPYRWSTDAALTLVQDLYIAFEKKIPEYRIGSAVLHPDNQGLNIVDGQQRLTTISIMLFALEDKINNDAYKNSSKLLEKDYSTLSCDAIVNNLEVIKQKLEGLDNNVLENFFTYVMNNCTIVKIVVGNEQEAFQFFDSQNSRGKGLAPHDLLKAYHLREMQNEPVSGKVKIINEWENVNQQEMVDLFSEHLYPSIRWYKNKDGLNYSIKDIKLFKGIRNRNFYNFSAYNKAANLYIEKFNAEGMYELTSDRFINQFQLTQPLIAGKRFFQYSLHYIELYEKINELVSTEFTDGEIVNSGSGDFYVYNMFINVLMFYVDRFNMEALTTARLKYFYKWAFSLRLCLKVVYKESVNKYAQGEHHIVNYGLKMFALISEMQDPIELDGVILSKMEKSMIEKSKINMERYKNMYEAVSGETYT